MSEIYSFDDDETLSDEQCSALWMPCVKCCVIGSLLVGITLAVIVTLWLVTPVTSNSITSTRLIPISITTPETSTSSSTQSTTSTTDTTITSTTSITTSTTSTTAFDSCNTLRWNQTGIRVAGDGTIGLGAKQLFYPTCVYLDVNDTIYICDSFNNRIQRWEQGASSGSTVAGGTSGTGLNQLREPQGLTFDRNGLMYVVDTLNDRVMRYSLSSTLGTIVVGNQGGKLMRDPISVVVDSGLNIYITDSGNDEIVKFSPTTNSTTSFFSNQVGKPYGIALGNNGSNQFFITERSTGRVGIWTMGTSTITTIIASSTVFTEPHTVITDTYGNVYVIDGINEEVIMFCANSWLKRTVISRSLGLNPILSETSGIAFDSDMNFYVTSRSPSGVYKFNRI